MKSFLISPRAISVRITRSAFYAALMVSAAATADTINKANNTTALDQTGSWTGGVVPTSADIAAFSSVNTVSSSPVTIGNGVNFGGILFSSNPATNLTINAGTGGSLTLGASGVDVSVGNRTLTFGTNATVAPAIVLSSNQTWTAGTAATAGTATIVSNSVISGSGGLTINGTGGGASIVSLFGNSTFSGGLTLNSSGAIRLTGTTPGFSGGVPTGSNIGTGNLTINGGTIFGNGGTLAPQRITVNADFNINLGTNAANGRLTIAGGEINLGGATRTVSLGRYTTAASSIGSGQESLRFTQSVGAPTISITNGTLRLVRDASGSPGVNDYVSVTLVGGSNFAAGAGLTIGDHVITQMGTGNPFGSTAGAQPMVTVESGGYFNMSDASNARSPIVRTLAGAGTVTSFSSNGSQTSTLTINPQSSDYATFSGNIVNGSSLTSVVAAAASPVALTVTGSGVQVLTGTNTYSGATAVNGATLIFGQTSAKSSASTVTANGTATIGLGVGGAGYYGSSDVDALFANTLTGVVMNASTRVGIDTTAGDFTHATSQGGSRGLTKFGTNALILTGANTYSGSTLIQGGSLQLGNGGTSGSLATGSTIVNNANFTVNRSDSVAQGTHFSGSAISGNGSFTQAGSGTTTLTVANTYTGRTIINAGVLALNAAGSFASSTLEFNLSNTSAGQLSVSNSSFAFSGTLYLGLSAFTLDGGAYQLFAGSEFGAGDLNLAALTSSLGSFANNLGVWTLVDGSRTFTFDQNLGSLTVVPEPGTYALATLGLLSIIMLARRRRLRAMR